MLSSKNRTSHSTKRIRFRGGTYTATYSDYDARQYEQSIIARNMGLVGKKLNYPHKEDDIASITDDIP